MTATARKCFARCTMAAVPFEGGGGQAGRPGLAHRVHRTDETVLGAPASGFLTGRAVDMTAVRMRLRAASAQARARMRRRRDT